LVCSSGVCTERHPTTHPSTVKPDKSASTSLDCKKRFDDRAHTSLLIVCDPSDRIFDRADSPDTPTGKSPAGSPRLQLQLNMCEPIGAHPCAIESNDLPSITACGLSQPLYVLRRFTLCVEPARALSRRNRQNDPAVTVFGFVIQDLPSNFNLTDV
jgi:hypothetical protein